MKEYEGDHSEDSGVEEADQEEEETIETKDDEKSSDEKSSDEKSSDQSSDEESESSSESSDSESDSTDEDKPKLEIKKRKKEPESKQSRQPYKARQGKVFAKNPNQYRFLVIITFYFFNIFQDEQNWKTYLQPYHENHKPPNLCSSEESLQHFPIFV